MITYYKLIDYLRKHDIKQKDLIQNKIVGGATLQRLRKNEPVNISVLDSLCDYLRCDLTDILEHKLIESDK